MKPTDTSEAKLETLSCRALTGSDCVLLLYFLSKGKMPLASAPMMKWTPPLVALRQAVYHGVKVQAFSCQVSPHGVMLRNALPVFLDTP